MKKSINLGDIIQSSGYKYNITLKQFNQKQYASQGERGLSPWIGKSQQLKAFPQAHQSPSKKQQTHQFLSKVILRKINYQPSRQQHSAVSNNHNSQQINNQLTIMPRTAVISKRSQAYSKEAKTMFISKNTYNNKMVKRSAVVSIQLNYQPNKQSATINPQILQTPKNKSINAYQINQKKKQLLRFKLRHNNKLNNLQQMERNFALKQYLKHVTEQPDKVNLFKNDRYRQNQHTPSRFTIKRQSVKFNPFKSIDLSTLICQGQVINNTQSCKTTHRMRQRKLNYMNQTDDLFY